MSTIPEKPKRGLSLLDRRLIVILLIVFVQIVGAAMVLPILPLYAVRQFDMTPQAVTLLITAFFAAQFVAGPFIGRLSDRYGRIPVLLVSQIGTVISFLMLGLAPNVAVLFFARILDGITGGNIIVAQAYVTDITPREQRTTALGYIFAVFGVGFIIGPAVGGILATTFTYQTPYLVAAAAAAIVVILTWLMLEETNTAEKRAEDALRQDAPMTVRGVMANLPLMSILAVTIGAQFAFSLLQSTFSLFGAEVLFAETPERAELGVGLLLAVFGVGQIFTQLFLLRRLIRRFGESRLLVFGGALRGLGMLGIALVNTPLTVILPMFSFAVGTGTQIPALQSLATTAVADSQRGAALGLYQSAFSLAIIFGGTVAGALFAIQPALPYWVGGGILVGMLIPSFFLMRWAHNQEDKRKNEALQASVAPIGD